jgi:hypothetical protein
MAGLDIGDFNPRNISVQGPQPHLPERRPPDSVEQRPQPSPEKNFLCQEMTAGRATSFFGTPQSADQGDVYGLNFRYGQASGGVAAT